MARYNYRELETLAKNSKSTPTEVKCYTYKSMAESCDEPHQVKTLQYTRRGLRMVGDPSLFDLEEPVWHPDEKVSCFVDVLLFNIYVSVCFSAFFSAYICA